MWILFLKFKIYFYFQFFIFKFTFFLFFSFFLFNFFKFKFFQILFLFLFLFWLPAYSRPTPWILLASGCRLSPGPTVASAVTNGLGSLTVTLGPQCEAKAFALSEASFYPTVLIKKKKTYSFFLKRITWKESMIKYLTLPLEGPEQASLHVTPPPF